MKKAISETNSAADETIADKKETTLEDIKQFILDAGSDDLPTFGGSFEGGAQIQQVPDEIAPCIKAILNSGDGILSYLEIGAAAGGSTFLISHFFSPGTVVLVDDNKHHKASLRPIILEGIAHEEIIGRSDSEESSAAAFERSPYDLMLIDGDHNYPGVKLDVITYLPMLRPGGFLILHDSAMPEWGVVRVVRELKADPGFEFIGEWVSATHPRPCGVALFRRVG
jgi:predicted O-methyltransferase YrrM